MIRQLQYKTLFLTQKLPVLHVSAITCSVSNDWHWLGVEKNGRDRASAKPVRTKPSALKSRVSNSENK